MKSIIIDIVKMYVSATFRALIAACALGLMIMLLAGQSKVVDYVDNTLAEAGIIEEPGVFTLAVITPDEEATAEDTFVLPDISVDDVVAVYDFLSDPVKRDELFTFANDQLIAIADSVED